MTAATAPARRRPHQGRDLRSAETEVRRKLRRARRILLFLDFDGTLAPIRPSPGLARLPAANRRLLRRLQQHPRCEVAIVTGRDLTDIRRRVRLPGLTYAAHHGLRIDGPRHRWTHPAALRAAPRIRGIARRLRRIARRFPGVRVEEKRFTVAVHYRQFPGEVRRLRSAVRTLLREEGEDLRLTRGKKVYELRPPTDWDKGRAVERIVRARAPRGRPLVIFCGDDLTDEDVFRRLRPHDLSVRVGRSARTAARHYVRDPAGVTWLLELMVRQLGGGAGRNAVRR